jgi:hypothetical protein
MLRRLVTYSVAEPNLRLPRTYGWNAALEQSFGSNQTLSLTYIGPVGRDLLRSTDLVSMNSNFGFVGFIVFIDSYLPQDYRPFLNELFLDVPDPYAAEADFLFPSSADRRSFRTASSENGF